MGALQSMHREIAEIIVNEPLGDGHYFMRIHAPKISQSWIPGQFINILPPVKAGRPPILRRPISILGSGQDNLEFVYRVRGCGTEILSKLTKGGTLDITGPLGNGFKNIPGGQGKHVLIAGGVGAPPVIALAKHLMSMGLEVDLYQGAQNRNGLIFHENLKTEKLKYICTTEDGSVGRKGLISELLPSNFKGILCVYACGPIGMLKAIFKWRKGASFKYFVSIETKMGCGVGVCLGCSIPTVDGNYVLACKDGPVLDADLVDWNKL